MVWAYEHAGRRSLTVWDNGYGLFAVLTFLFIYPVHKTALPLQVKRNLAVKIVIAACSWALATEFIQKFFIADRDFDAFDWISDSLGIAVAWAWCRIKYLK